LAAKPSLLLPLIFGISKMDGITKLGEHLEDLLAPVDGTDELPNLETPQFDFQQACLIPYQSQKSNSFQTLFNRLAVSQM